MARFLRRLVTLRRDEKGVTAVEYGLITALIALAIVGTLNTASDGLNAMLKSLGSRLVNATNADSTTPGGQ